ncbi:MAG: Gx transporter family protein, partial [Nitrospinota bacterium]|nr:Gx transporter family protein [Nitrospinota bacterium]
MDRIENSHRRMATIALLVGLGVVLHRLEALLPLPTPWVKLGLANIMTLIALVFLGFRAAVEVTLLRILLGSV